MQCRLCWFRRKSSSTSYAFDQLSEFSSFFFFCWFFVQKPNPSEEREVMRWRAEKFCPQPAFSHQLSLNITTPLDGKEKSFVRDLPIARIYEKKKKYINVWQKYDKCTHMLHYFSKRRASPWFHSWEKTALTFYWIELHVLWADKKVTRRWKAKTKVATFHLRH